MRLDNVINKSLENEPDRRYQQASEVKMAVDAISSAAQRGTSSPITFKQVVLDWWLDIRASRTGILRSDTHILAVGIIKWLALASHVFCFFQLVRVIGIDEETRSIGWWMVKSHRSGKPLEFFNAPGPLLAWFAAGAAAYYFYWRIKKTETGSSERFHYPFQYIVLWVLMIAYGVSVVLDSAASFIPSSIMLLVLFLVITSLHQAWNKLVVAWDFQSDSYS